MAPWRKIRPRTPEQHAGMPEAPERIAAAPAGPRHHSLRRKLALATTLAGLCTIGLAALLIARSYGDYAAARQSLYDISEYRLTLDAANVLSAERGPANSVLGEAPAAHSAARDRLREFRARSDAALARLASPPDALPGLHAHHVPPLMIERVRERLERARAEVDRLGSSRCTSARWKTSRRRSKACSRWWTCCSSPSAGRSGTCPPAATAWQRPR